MNAPRILLRQGYVRSVFDVEAYNARRRELKLQQWAVAQLAGISPTVLSRLVTGRDMPANTDELILQIETGLDMRPGSLRRKTPPVLVAPPAPAPAPIAPPVSVATVVPVVPPVYAPPPPPQPPPFDHAGFAAKLLEEAKTLTRREAEALLDVRLRKFAETQITHAGIDDIVEKRVRLVTSTIDSTLARQTAQVDKATETNRAIRADLSAQIEKLRDKVDQLREQTQKLEEAHGRAGTRLYRITQHLTAEFKALSALRVLADLVAATLRRDMLHTGSHKIPPSEDEKLLMREAEQAVEILHARRPPKLEG